MKNLSLVFLGSCLLCAHSAAAQDGTSSSDPKFKASASTAEEQTAITKQRDASITTEAKKDQPAKATTAGNELGSPGPELGTGFHRGLAGGGSAQVSGPTSRMVSADNLIIAWSEDNDQLRGFSLANGKWTILDVPVQKRLVPIVGKNIAAVKLKNGMAAYSAETQRWAILSLPEQSKAVPVLSNSLVTVYDSDHIYTFAASNGRWTSPTDKALEETKEVIPSGNLTYSKQQIDEAVEGLSLIVSSSRSSLTARGAKKDVAEFKQRLAKLKPSGQTPRSFFIERSPLNSPSAGPGIFQTKPPVQPAPSGNYTFPSGSLAPRTSAPAPRQSNQPSVSQWVQPQPAKSPRQVLNPPASLPGPVPPRFNSNANQPIDQPGITNVFPTPASLPAATGLAGLPNFPATGIPYGAPAEIRFSDSFFSRPPTSKSETSSLLLAKKLRSKQQQQPLAKSDKADLEKLVSAALEERLKAQQKSVDELRKKLKAVEQKLKSKSDNKQKMIDRRVDELLNPELDWDAVSTKGRRSEFPQSFFSGTSNLSKISNLTAPISSPFANSKTKPTQWNEASRFSFTDALAKPTNENQSRLSSGQVPTQIPNDLAGMSMQLQTVLAGARKSVVVAKQKLTQNQADRQKVSKRLRDTEEISSKDQQFLSAIELKIRKIDEAREEYEANVATNMRNWKSAWQQFTAAMDLQKARVKVAEAVFKNETEEAERMESLFKQAAISRKSAAQARIQVQMAGLQLKTQQETLAQFERILTAEPELDPDYSASKDQQSDISPNPK